MKKKIVHVLGSNSYSGAENVVITIIKKLENHFDFIYVTKSGPIEKVLKKENIKYYIIKEVSNKEIEIMYEKIKPDIIHAHDFRAGLMCASLYKKIPIISHLHNNPSWIKKINIKTLSYYLATRKFNKILLVSKSIKEEFVFSKYLIEKSEIIDNPLSINKIINKVTELKQKKYDICFVGRLTEQKDPLRFLEIIEEIKKKKNNIKIVMVGSGELENDIKKIINEKKMNKNIEMTGFVENPYDYISKSNVLCLPSKWEGFGLVAFEALALGVPSVVSNVGGLPTIVDSKCGFLCNTNDDFVNALISLIEDAEMLKKYQKEAIKKANKLDNINFYCKKISNIYNNTN